MMATLKHTPTPQDVEGDLQSAMIEAKALTGILAHVSASSIPVTHDEVMVIANSLDRAVGAIDRTVTAALAAWKAEKDRELLLITGLGPLSAEQAAKLAAMTGAGDV